MVYDTTQHLSDLVAPFNQQAQHFSIHQYLDKRPVLFKTNHYMNSFLPSTIKIWNALSNEIKQNRSISNFKHFLSTKSPRCKIPPYYLISSRSEDKLLPNCSLPNAHLHSRNIVESPNCLGSLDSHPDWPKL